MEILKIRTDIQDNGKTVCVLFDETSGAEFLRGTASECHRAKVAIETMESIDAAESMA